MEGTLVFLVILAISAGIGYLIWWWNSSGQLSFETKASFEQIVQTSIKLTTVGGYITTTQVGQSATFTRQLGGGGCIGLLLLLLLLIPGVVYLVVHKNQATLALNVQSLESGNLVSLHYNHRGTAQSVTKQIQAALV